MLNGLVALLGVGILFLTMIIISRLIVHKNDESSLPHTRDRLK